MNLTLPQASLPLVPGVPMTPTWYRWARDITERCGGVTGASTTDLAESAFEDAGIEETKADAYRLRDELQQAQSIVRELAERLSACERELQALKQGTLV